VPGAAKAHEGIILPPLWLGSSSEESRNLHQGCSATYERSRELVEAVPPPTPALCPGSDRGMVWSSSASTTTWDLSG
jgi:hypothetical protein